MGQCRATEFVAVSSAIVCTGRVVSNSQVHGRMTKDGTAVQLGERGSSLILALVYLIVGSLIVTALASWTGNDLRNTKGFQASAATLYAADGAAQLAIQAARYIDLPLGTAPCPGADPVTIDSVTVAAFCSEQMRVGFSRVVTVNVYIDLTNSGNPLTQAPNNSPLLTTVVGYGDDETRTGAGSYVCSPTPNSDCGLTMDVIMWKVQQ